MQPSFKEEPIPVGRPRPTAQPVTARRVPTARITSAGELSFLVLALVVAAGWGVGELLSVPIAGALVGGFCGAVAAFVALYYRYRDI